MFANLLRRRHKPLEPHRDREEREDEDHRRQIDRCNRNAVEGDDAGEEMGDEPADAIR